MKIKATVNNQELELDIDEQSLVKAGYVKAKKEFKRWRARVGEEYFYIDTDGEVDRTTELGYSNDDGSFVSGNYYQTEELAQQALDCQLALVRVNDRILELNEGWEPGIEEEVGNKPFTEIRYSFHNKSFYRWLIWGSVTEHKIDLIKNSEVADQIISECESDLKVIFGV